MLATGTFGIEEAHITEAPERCDPTDKWSPVTCDDALPVEVANNDVYTPDFIIPRGIGYYHKRDQEIDDASHGDRAHAPGSFSKRPAHNSVGWVWGQNSPTDFDHGEDEDIHADENITTGIGYYTPDKFANPLDPVLGDTAPIQEVKEEVDVIPHGLGYYSGALETGEFQEAHLRDPKYRAWAYRLAYPQHPDYESRAKFFDEMDVFPCTSSREPLRC